MHIIPIIVYNSLELPFWSKKWLLVLLKIVVGVTYM